jgi:hypothetical protein
MSPIALAKTNEKYIKIYLYVVFFMGYQTILEPGKINEDFGKSGKKYEAKFFCKLLYMAGKERKKHRTYMWWKERVADPWLTISEQRGIILMIASGDDAGHHTFWNHTLMFSTSSIPELHEHYTVYRLEKILLQL